MSRQRPTPNARQPTPKGVIILNLLGVGRWELGVGRWALDVGRWTLDVGRWALGVGRWALDVGRWALGVETATGDIHGSITLTANGLPRTEWPCEKDPLLLGRGRRLCYRFVCNGGRTS